MIDCLVSGGTGFVGFHLVDRLTSLGYSVKALHGLDGLDRLKQCRFDVIFHLACFPRSMSFNDPYHDVDVNVKGTVRILELAKKTKAKVLFSSNAGIYGTTTELPVTEAFPDNPSSPYDIDKLAAEHYLRFYNQAYGVPVTVFRLATVYGSRQRVSEVWKPIVAEFVTKMLRGVSPTIEGDGTQTRDFIHVSDVVEGLVRAMDVETGPEPIILSSNTETSINELYSTIGGLLNYFPRAMYKPQKANDVKRMWFDNSRAKKLLGWEAKMLLKEGLVKDVVPYYQKQLEVQNEVATGHGINANL